MIFTKPMIDLVQEIRKRVPSEHKSSIKLSDPNLLNVLIPIHRSCSDAILQALLKDLFFKAGEDWLDKLEAGEIQKEKYVTRVYRGQVQLVPVSKETSEKASVKTSRKVYRGQVIA